ncbi:MAG: hypothetical protein GXO32_03645 [Crenarchaeota archaeon]|nr:hypothetical protein [Thermoproteota archaeon]
MKLFGDKKKRGVSELTPEISQLVEEYASNRGIDFAKALEELIRKGYRYAQLERMYGKSMHDREVWDKRFYYLKVEAGYLYYRLRFRDLLEELRSMAMILMGTVRSLELCYQRYAPKTESVLQELKELEKLKRIAKHYTEQYVLSGRKELEEKKYADDEEVLKSIEETVKRYKKVLGRGDEQAGIADR